MTISLKVSLFTMEYLRLDIIHHISVQPINNGTILMMKEYRNSIFRIYKINVLEEFNKIRSEMIRTRKKMLIY
jgi:hypothetical protein